MTGFGFVFASDPFSLHPVFFVCILSFCLHYLFCLYPIFFVCSKPFNEEVINDSNKVNI